MITTENSKANGSNGVTVHTDTGPREKTAQAKRAPLARVERKALGEVTFKGLFTVRVLLGADGKRRVVVNEIAGNMGLDAKSLRDRVNGKHRKGGAVMALPSGGGEQEVLALDIRYLPALLPMVPR